MFSEPAEAKFKVFLIRKLLTFNQIAEDEADDDRQYQ